MKAFSIMYESNDCVKPKLFGDDEPLCYYKAYMMDMYMYKMLCKIKAGNMISSTPWFYRSSCVSIYWDFHLFTNVTQYVYFLSFYQDDVNQIYVVEILFVCFFAGYSKHYLNIEFCMGKKLNFVNVGEGFINEKTLMKTILRYINRDGLTVLYKDSDLFTNHIRDRIALEQKVLVSKRLLLFLNSWYMKSASLEERKKCDHE